MYHLSTVSIYLLIYLSMYVLTGLLLLGKRVKKICHFVAVAVAAIDSFRLCFSRTIFSLSFQHNKRWHILCSSINVGRPWLLIEPEKMSIHSIEHRDTTDTSTHATFFDSFVSFFCLTKRRRRWWKEEKEEERRRPIRKGTREEKEEVTIYQLIGPMA